MPRSKRITKSSTRISFQKDFFSDLTAPGLLTALIVRSPTRTGYLTSISHPDLPEGYFLFTAKDIPGQNSIQFPGGNSCIFADGKISYLGEPIGILVGPDENLLKELLSEIEIVFDDEEQTRSFSKQKALFAEIEDSVKTDSLSETIKESDIKLASRTVKYGPCFNEIEGEDGTKTVPGIASVFSECHEVTKGCWSYTTTFPDFTEPNGALATFTDGSLTVFTPAQWPSFVRSTLVNALNLQPENIIIKKTQVTDSSSSGVWYNAIISAQVSLACMKTGKSVKLVLLRKEQEAFLNSARPITITHKTGIDEEGNLLAMQIVIDVDAGSMNPFAQEILDRLVIASCGCYSPKNLYITANVFRSPHPPAAVNLKLIDAAAFYAVENQIGKLCAQSGFSPIDLRLKNFSRPMQGRKHSEFPFRIEMCRPDEAFLALAKINDLRRKYTAYELDAKNRVSSLNMMKNGETSISPLRGIGLSCAFEGSAYMGSSLSDAGMTIELTQEENNTYTIHCPQVSLAMQDIFRRIVCGSLDVNPSSVKINSEFAADEESPTPEIMHSNVSILTSLLEKCCNTIKNRKNSTSLPFTVKKKLSAAKRNEWNKKTFKGCPYYNAAFGAAVVEVEFDQNTYREVIRGIHIVVNGGKLLHTQSAEYAIKRAIQKTLSYLVEQDSLTCDKIKISFVQSTESPTEIGTLVYQLIPAAYTRAISQALGCTVSSIPLRTDSLYERLCEEKIKRAAEEKARIEAEERAKKEAEEKAKLEAEEKAKREAEEKAQREAEEKAQREAEEKAKREAEEKAKREEEEKAKQEAEEKTKGEAEKESEESHQQEKETPDISEPQEKSEEAAEGESKK